MGINSANTRILFNDESSIKPVNFWYVDILFLFGNEDVY
jgi:hypothetical protein